MSKRSNKSIFLSTTRQSIDDKNVMQYFFVSRVIIYQETFTNDVDHQHFDLETTLEKEFTMFVIESCCCTCISSSLSRLRIRNILRDVIYITRYDFVKRSHDYVKHTKDSDVYNDNVCLQKRNKISLKTLHLELDNQKTNMKMTCLIVELSN